jgi:hypothetical protein
MHKNVVLVGHKCDLDEKRQVTAEQGKELADANGWLFFETSAKCNINVSETFMAAARVGLCGVWKQQRQVGLCEQQGKAAVSCRKFDPAAFLARKWEVIWARVQNNVLVYGKTDASTMTLSGIKFDVLDEFEGSRHILVLRSASDQVHRTLPHMLHPPCASVIRNFRYISPSQTHKRATISRQAHLIYCRFSLHTVHFNLKLVLELAPLKRSSPQLCLTR